MGYVTDSVLKRSKEILGDREYIDPVTAIALQTLLLDFGIYITMKPSPDASKKQKNNYKKYKYLLKVIESENENG